MLGLQGASFFDSGGIGFFGRKLINIIFYQRIRDKIALVASVSLFDKLPA